MPRSTGPDGPVPIHQPVRDRIVPIYQQVSDRIVPIYQRIRDRIVEAIAVGELPAGSVRPGWEREWAGRLRTLLAEAAAQGLPANDIIRHCRAARPRGSSAE